MLIFGLVFEPWMDEYNEALMNYGPDEYTSDGKGLGLSNPFADNYDDGDMMTDLPTEPTTTTTITEPVTETGDPIAETQPEPTPEPTPEPVPEPEPVPVQVEPTPPVEEPVEPTTETATGDPIFETEPTAPAAPPAEEATPSKYYDLIVLEITDDLKYYKDKVEITSADSQTLFKETTTYLKTVSLNDKSAYFILVKYRDDLLYEYAVLSYKNSGVYFEDQLLTGDEVSAYRSNYETMNISYSFDKQIQYYVLRKTATSGTTTSTDDPTITPPKDEPVKENDYYDPNMPWWMIPFLGILPASLLGFLGGIGFWYWLTKLKQIKNAIDTFNKFRQWMYRMKDYAKNYKSYKEAMQGAIDEVITELRGANVDWQNVGKFMDQLMKETTGRTTNLVDTFKSFPEPGPKMADFIQKTLRPEVMTSLESMGSTANIIQTQIGGVVNSVQQASTSITSTLVDFSQGVQAASSFTEVTGVSSNFSSLQPATQSLSSLQSLIGSTTTTIKSSVTGSLTFESIGEQMLNSGPEGYDAITTAGSNLATKTVQDMMKTGPPFLVLYDYFSKLPSGALVPSSPQLMADIKLVGSGSMQDPEDYGPVLKRIADNMKILINSYIEMIKTITIAPPEPEPVVPEPVVPEPEEPVVTKTGDPIFEDTVIEGDPLDSTPGYAVGDPIMEDTPLQEGDPGYVPPTTQTGDPIFEDTVIEGDPLDSTPGYAVGDPVMEDAPLQEGDPGYVPPTTQTGDPIFEDRPLQEGDPGYVAPTPETTTPTTTTEPVNYKDYFILQGFTDGSFYCDGLLFNRFVLLPEEFYQTRSMYPTLIEANTQDSQSTFFVHVITSTTPPERDFVVLQYRVDGRVFRMNDGLHLSPSQLDFYKQNYYLAITGNDPDQQSTYQVMTDDRLYINRLTTKEETISLLRVADSPYYTIITHNVTLNLFWKDAELIDSATAMSLRSQYGEFHRDSADDFVWYYLAYF